VRKDRYGCMAIKVGSKSQEITRTSDVAIPTYPRTEREVKVGHPSKTVNGRVQTCR
jgi:hypothetical protein